MMQAAILTIGDELLNGQTVDTNSAWIGQELGAIGVKVTAKMSVSDSKDAIQHGLDTLYRDANLVIITGGLGPTDDDVTKKSIADYLGDELVFSEETYDRLAGFFKKRGRTPLDAHRQQCMLPSSAELITNQRGTAPGMWIQQGERYMLSMPGVPAEMKGLMKGGGLQRIADLNPDRYIDYQIIKTVGTGESVISERTQPILKNLPDHMEMAYLPSIGSVKLRLTAIGHDEAQVKADNAQVAAQIEAELGDLVYGRGDITLQESVGRLAMDRGWMIGTAESCTGGHISQLITSKSGSSRYYKGSVIAYANEIKTDILGVSTVVLQENGAVSEPVVRQMVLGLIDHLGVDLAVAVSGIAGPTGGTPEKPVGTIWMAVGTANQVITKKLSLSKTRDLNIRYTAVAALAMMRRFMMKTST